MLLARTSLIELKILAFPRPRLLSMIRDPRRMRQRPAAILAAVILLAMIGVIVYHYRWFPMNWVPAAETAEAKFEKRYEELRTAAEKRAAELKDAVERRTAELKASEDQNKATIARLTRELSYSATGARRTAEGRSEYPLTD